MARRTGPKRVMARRRKGRPVDGWLILDKPGGLGSTDAVNRLRRLLDAQKAGHAGTLDPMATGILAIAFGEATKTIPYIQDAQKTYRFTVRFGQATDTDDATGQVTGESPVRPSNDQIIRAMAGFMGKTAQVPPAYSAVHVDGARAYDLARAGQEFELKAKEINILRLELEDRPDPDHASFLMRCGKGTYVRSLARDLAARLGALAHVTVLRRTVLGPFGEAGAIPVEKLGFFGHKGGANDHLLPVETALDDIPALAVTGPQADRLRSGQEIRVIHRDDGISRVMNAGTLVALAEIEDGCVRPVRVFNL